MPKFLTGKDYPHLCPECRDTIDSVVELMGDAEDTDDDEAPCNFVYDHAMYCGGRTCIGGFGALKREVLDVLVVKSPNTLRDVMAEVDCFSKEPVTSALSAIAKDAGNSDAIRGLAQALAV